MSATPRHGPATVPLLLDCDTGIDDALALLHLVALTKREPRLVRPVGIVCTAGNVGVSDTLRNTLAWLDLAGADEVPVCAGADRPLVGFHALTPETHGPRGSGHAVLPEPRRRPDPRVGAQLWVDLAHRHPGELLGLVTGPASTLAAALELEPELPHLLRRLVVMGGSFRGHRGNTTPVAEWNTHVDPEAADAVCAAWERARTSDPSVAPMLWCGLDVTEQALLMPHHLDRLPHTPAADLVREAVRFYFEFHEWVGEGYLAQVHDPAVLHVALGLAPVRTATARMRVECSGTWTRGMTVADVGPRHGGVVNAELLTSVTTPGGMADVVDAVVASVATVLA